MACRPDPAADAPASCCGGGCGSQRPFPWASALTDPAFLRLLLRRFRRELLLGAGSGCLAALAALVPGEALGGLGPMLGGPWLQFHAVAMIPAALLAGLVLALGGRGRTAAAFRALVCLLLGGAGNGLLETGGGLTAFLSGGGWVSLLAFAGLGLPAIGAAWWGLARLWPDRSQLPTA